MNKFKKFKNYIFGNILYKLAFKIVLFIISASLTAIFFINTFIKYDMNVIDYSELSSSDYTVRLKENNYYNVDELPSGMGYIASLIDNINIKFKYNFSSTSKLDYGLSYFIDAVVKVYDDTDSSKVLFEKEERLADGEQLFLTDTDKYLLEKDVDIDYQKYNTLIKSFKTDYGLNNNAELIIVLNIKSDGKVKGFDDKFVSTGVAKVLVPLTERTVNVKIDNTDIDNKGQIVQRLDNSFRNNANLVVFALFTIMSLVILVYIIKDVFKMSNNKSKYSKTLNRILKENDSIIANVVHNVDITNSKVVKISSFEELRDVHDNLGSPILFSEDVKRNVSYFTIVKDGLVYEYTLKDEELLDIKNLGGKNEKTKKKQK